MRFTLPVIGAALALSVGVSPAVAPQHPDNGGHHPHHQPHTQKRGKTHGALPVSKHSVLTGDGVTVRGKVRPSGGHRVKVVFGGTDHEVLTLHTKSNGTFRAKWDVSDIGNYDVTAHAIGGKKMRASHSKVRHLT